MKFVTVHALGVNDRDLQGLPPDAEGRRDRSPPALAFSATASAALAAQLIRWDEIAQILEPLMPQNDGRHWYAPESMASMIRAYFVRRWFNLTAAQVCSLFDSALRSGCTDARSIDRFDFIFEHYQLKDIAQPLIERQLLQSHAAGCVAGQLGNR